MSKQPVMAQAISVANCECCGGVHIQLFRNGKLFAVAIPHTVETVDRLMLDLVQAAAIMRKAGGKPHVH